MLRRLFTILSVLSRLLCIATCVLWVRSYKIAYLPTFLHLNSSNRLVIATQAQPLSVDGKIGIAVRRVWFYTDTAEKSRCDFGKVVCVRDEATGTVSPQRPGWTWEENDLNNPGLIHESGSGFLGT